MSDLKNDLMFEEYVQAITVMKNDRQFFTSLLPPVSSVFYMALGPML